MRVPLTSSASTVGEPPLAIVGWKAGSSAPVTTSTRASRARAWPLTVPNAPPRYNAEPETASARTVPLAEAVNAVSTLPSACSFTSRCRGVPFTCVNSPPSTQPPPGTATTARTRPLRSRRGSTGAAESRENAANPNTRLADGATVENDPPT
ncbi:MAG: hypothetical protein R2708_14905 [Vicinamibacterales bacterium]